MDRQQASKHLGHTSVKTTEIYLAYLMPEEKQAVMFGKAQVKVAPKLAPTEISAEAASSK